MTSTIRNIFLGLLLASLIISSKANAEVIVENVNVAMNRDIFETDFYKNRNRHVAAPHVEPKVENNSNRYNYNYDYNKDENKITNATPQVDYKAVADKLIPNNDVNGISLVDLNDYNTSIVVSRGQFIAVRLDEEAKTKWNFENRGDILEFVKSEKRGDVIIMLYRASGLGSSKVNFDKLSFDSQSINAVDSKVLEVRVM